jgi:hypothetical protein
MPKLRLWLVVSITIAAAIGVVATISKLPPRTTSTASVSTSEH